MLNIAALVLSVVCQALLFQRLSESRKKKRIVVAVDVALILVPSQNTENIGGKASFAIANVVALSPSVHGFGIRNMLISLWPSGPVLAAYGHVVRIQPDRRDLLHDSTQRCLTQCSTA